MHNSSFAGWQSSKILDAYCINYLKVAALTPGVGTFFTPELLIVSLLMQALGNCQAIKVKCNYIRKMRPNGELINLQTKNTF